MSKTITIKNAVYDELVSFKKENESFSELLDRLVKSQSKREFLLTLRGSVDFENKDGFLAEMRDKRQEKRE
ncbi:antitoxin VapB family protein [Cuniculiplasma sp. SKW3]|uniref:antitoxin VapB family protein n=1 Tax=unclassified Cuniculiplasma TaxID=2619706 RepID=UPI003FD5017A